MRLLLVIGLCFGQLYAQSLGQRLAAPIFYELGLQSGYQSNPLNLSGPELEKAAAEPDYLDGAEYSSSQVITAYGKLHFAPALLGGRKTRVGLQAYYHQYLSIPQRNYQSYALTVKQSLGKYRYLSAGYNLLPHYYLRNYRFADTASLIVSRQPTVFGTDRLWLGFEHRLTIRDRLSYRLSRRQELYQAPFARYDLEMLEASLKLHVGHWQQVPFQIEYQYGQATNANELDTKNRSYRYLNVRPSLSVTLPGQYRLRIAGRYDQRSYASEAFDDPLHAGRYQEEFRLDISLIPHLNGPLVIEPLIGYRERRVASQLATVSALKSFTRYWFGIRVGYKSVIDMYF